MKRVTGIEYSMVKFLMTINVCWVGLKAYKNPFRLIQAALKLSAIYKKMFQGKRFVRAFKINNKYVWDLFTPAWPSKAFNSFFISRLHETEPISINYSSLRRLLVAITKKCPLHCEHCCESETLYQDDVLTYEELKDKMDDFVQRGVGQLIYSGGEPLSRFDDLVNLISHFKNDCDQWIYTSGYGLTMKKAEALKSAGLNGAAISLDHHLEEGHNHFRGNNKSYFWVREAIMNCNATRILTALNVCPTIDYLSSYGFEDYVKIAKELDVPIINIIEPRAVGNYNGKNVHLGFEQKQELFRVRNKFNYNKSMIDYPTIVYSAEHAKSLPCGGGKSYLYLDYDGKIYPCPFCKVQLTENNVNEKVCQVEYNS